MTKSVQILLVSLMSWGTMAQHTIPNSFRSRRAVKKCSSVLKKEFEQKKLTWGSPVYIRIFKEKSKLEVWVENGNTYTHFKEYQICNFSGNLGPKMKEGDRQAPEGFYEVTPSQLNPHSDYHLSFNLGYPNAYDLAHQYTGSALMVHGNCVSVGCYAMTDERIEEIYTLVQTAFQHGQKAVPVHAFPFEMTEQNLANCVDRPEFNFWENLREGYAFFEKNTFPPRVNVKDKKYVFE